MNAWKAFGVLLPLLAATACDGLGSPSYYCDYPSAEVPGGDMSTEAFFYYGDNLHALSSPTTHMSRTTEGYDGALGEYTASADYTMYNSDIIHGSSLLTFEKDSSEIETQKYELRHIGDGYIHTIHEEEGWENDYRISVENNTKNYRNIFYLGMDQGFFRYFDHHYVYDESRLQRSGIIVGDFIFLYVSYVTHDEISTRLNLKVTIQDDFVTELKIERTAFAGETELMSEVTTETYSQDAKQDFPWGTIDWYNYHDYPER